MISKLRNKLITINIICTGVVFFIAVVLIFSIGYSEIGEERRTRMNNALLYNPADDDFSTNVLYSDMALAVYNKDSDSFVWYTGSDFCYDVNELADCVRNAVNRNVNAGLTHFKLRYRLSTDNDSSTARVVFNDLDSAGNGLSPYLVFALCTLVMGLAVCFVISYMLATVALRPVEESWAKQKQFVADASHELKTPLSVIMANTEIIASHANETVESQMRWVENTREESKRMAELVASLLFLAKNDDGLKVELTKVNLSDCIFTTVLGQDAMFYENGKKFDYELAHDLFVVGNESQLKQLVTILLDNANKYSTGDGNIALNLVQNGKNAVLTVADDGPQLSQDQLAHLFDRFYTVDKSRNSRGNGLGLSIAKTIVDTHGGTINVDCKECRTTFTVTLPLFRN